MVRPQASLQFSPLGCPLQRLYHPPFPIPFLGTYPNPKPKMSTFSSIAQTSFSNSTAYDAHRPTYPAESVQHLLEQCRVAGKRGARIVDLAAGTGKFTEALAAREEGFEIIAVEPHADMRKVLKERGLKGVTVLDGTAEDVPVENGWADAVFVAQVGIKHSHFSSSSLSSTALLSQQWRATQRIIGRRRPRLRIGNSALLIKLYHNAL